MGPAWLVLDHPTAEEGDVIKPGNYDLCSEACLQKLVAGEPPLNELDLTLLPSFRPTPTPLPVE